MLIKHLYNKNVFCFWGWWCGKSRSKHHYCTPLLLSHRHFFPLALYRHNYGEEHPKYADTLVDYGFYLLNVDAIHLSVEVYKVGELILTWNFVCFSLFVIYFLLFIAPCTKVKKELMSHFYIFGNKHRWSTKCIVDANNFHSI